MKKLILALVILSYLSAAFSQEREIYAASPVYINYNISELMNVFDTKTSKIVDRHSDIEGSPYVFDDFIPGTVYSRMEKAAFHIDLNMNAVTSLFEFSFQGDIYEMPNFAFDSVVIGESVFIPVSIVENDRIELYSMEIIASDFSGNYLLKRFIVEFMDRVDEKPFIEAKPARFKRFPPIYFLYINHDRLIELDNLRKLADDAAMPVDLDSFIRKNKISKRNEGDLKQLFYYISGNM